jgi:CheY-like chemotaxis protein
VIPAEVPDALIGDPLRLRQILVNLVGNAIKFTEAGEITVEVKLKRDVDERMEILFSVADTGVGIPPDKLRSVFSSFSQADTSITRKYGGTGLGLAISQQLVKLMNGDIWVESEQGRGSTFYFTVILERGSDRSHTAVRDVLGVKDLHVLVVDDNATNRRILRDTLRSFGCLPELAEGGKEGLEMMHRALASEHPFEMVLLDVQMPDISGLDVLREVRRTPELQSLPVIILTSVDMLQAVTEQEELGWSAYLTKPIKQSMLFDAIVDCLGEAAAPLESPMGAELVPDATEGFQSLQILLVEDNMVNRLVAQALLEQAGHRVVAAENGRLALESLEGNTYDLVFMDVEMPEMDGFEAARIIRSDPRWSHLPIVAMTAHAMKGDRERCLAAGMDDYISKPLRADALRAAIARQTATEGHPAHCRGA